MSHLTEEYHATPRTIIGH